MNPSQAELLLTAFIMINTCPNWPSVNHNYFFELAFL